MTTQVLTHAPPTAAALVRTMQISQDTTTLSMKVGLAYFKAMTQL